MTQNGKRMTVVSFTAFGKFRVNGTINDQNLVELVQTRIPNPVLGDMLWETRYTEYRDFGGVKFPTVLHMHQGDVRLNPGHNTMEVRVTNAQPNIPVAPVAVPDNVRQAKAAPVRVEPQKLADGVWLMTGGSHNSVAVEFADFITVVEAPQNEARSIAVINAVRQVIPGKPIRYVVNTHHHFDHLGGVRTYVAEGVTVVTHQANRDFYDQVVFYPAARTLEPDRLDTYFPLFSAQRRVDTKLVSDKYEITDGVRTLHVYPVEGLAHAASMLLAFLPQERILVNADMYSPPVAGQPAPAPNPSMIALHQNIQRLKLDVSQHVPIHGTVGTMDAFLKVVGAQANAGPQ
jgi:glyoxylase-like metal-dependent hydrolase (beta-lactamase superfamily II)